MEKQAPPGRRIDWFNPGSGETPDEPSVTDIQAIEFDTQYPTVPRYAVPERPILLDVTPRGLGVATVSGYCDEIIPRNSQIPIEQTRVFTTAKPEQTSVEIKVCQGESRRFEENLQLGVLVLEQLPRRARGDARISVTFEIDTDGILQVRAVDEETGQKQAARIQILGAQSTTEIEAAKSRIRGLKEA